MRTIPLAMLAKGDMATRIGTTDINPPSEVLGITASFPATPGTVEVGIALDDDKAIYVIGPEGEVTADILDPAELFFRRRRRFFV